jgi:hypothetical protein
MTVLLPVHVEGYTTVTAEARESLDALSRSGFVELQASLFCCHLHGSS